MSESTTPLLTAPPNPRAGSALLFGLIFLLVVVLDQTTKLAALNSFEPGDVRPVVEGVFNLTLAFNRGVAFGLFADFPDGIRYLLLGLSACGALAAVVYFFVREYAHDVIARGALVLVLGGAVGNIIDRVRLGVVVDFLDFYLGEYHWPAFNVADSAICVGVFILLFRRSATEDDSK